MNMDYEKTMPEDLHAYLHAARGARRITSLVGLVALALIVLALLLTGCGGGGAASGNERGISYDGELKVDLVENELDGVTVRFTNTDEKMSNIFIVRRVEFDGYAALVEDDRVTSTVNSNKDGEDGFFFDLAPGESVDATYYLDKQTCVSLVLLCSETLYVEGGTPYQYDDLRLEAHA